MIEACGCEVEYTDRKISRVNATRCYAFMTREQKEEFNK